MFVSANLSGVAGSLVSHLLRTIVKIFPLFRVVLHVTSEASIALG